ncbi:MAG: carbohydrate-binding domain-containing protein, partial [Ruminiclostridium sp.]|nr:carbohydrate-binding domain-containing protein [Ruminiclostridium sp.]
VMMKKSLALVLSGAVAVSALLSGCSGSNSDNSVPADTSAAAVGNIKPETTGESDKKAPQQDADVSHDIKENNACTVDIGSDVFISGNGAAYEDGVLSLTKGGTYTLSGSISDGYVYIDTEENVKLVLSGFSIKNSSGSALYCYNAKNLYIELGENTENSLEDGAVYSFEGKNQSSAENEPNAALYSKSDLFIYGKGSLDVKGNYGLAIRCNDDLVIEQGTITAVSATNGIRGSDSVTVSGGAITVNAEKDGIKTTNDSDSEKGNIIISGGTVNVTAGEDGIQSAQALSVSGGELTVTTTGEVAEGGNDGWWFGGRSNASEDSTSKGIKSSGAMTVSGGRITVNSTDHCIHSADVLDISGGELVLSSSKGKGISAHGDLTVNGGSIDVQNSTEGLESKAVFTINGGDITVNASDDGLNSGGGSDMWG